MAGRFDLVRLFRQMPFPYKGKSAAALVTSGPLRDRYVGPAFSLGLERWLGSYTRETIDAGHRVVLRDPKGIAARIDRFAGLHPPVNRMNGVSAYVASA